MTNGISVNLRSQTVAKEVDFNQYNLENGFESFSPSELQAGTERMAYPVFFKTTNCWRIGDVSATKFKDVSPKITLPVGSILHLFDNFKKIEMKEPINDIPSFDLPFINNETFRKYLYHQLVPLTDGELKAPNDYIYRTMQLQKNIEKFRAQNSGRFLPVKKLEPLNTTGPYLGIINHNPVYRLFVRGQLPYWRALERILTSMFNVALQIPNKNHYFLIPITPKIFTKGKFQQSASRITTGSLLFKDSYQYLFFIQLYNFLNETCTIKTIFDQIPQEMWPKINLVFSYADEYLFWTLKDLKALNARNQIYTRIFNHFNGFILKGIAKETFAQLNIQKEEDTQVEKTTSTSNLQDARIEVQLIDEFSRLTGTPKEDIANEQEVSVDPDMITQQEEQELNVLLKSINGVTFQMGNKETELDDREVNEILNPDEQQEPAEIVEVTEASVNLSQGTTNTPIAKDVTPYYKEEELDEIILPNEKYNPYQTPEQIEKLGITYLDQIDKLALNTIKKDQSLTQASKDRATRLALSYRDVSLGDTPIVEIMTKKVNPEISKGNTITPLEGAIDSGMLGSSITNLDKEYMDKLHLPHLLSVATSMSAHGMYLHDIEERVTNTELTQTKDYTFKYKTTTGKQHSINFSMPIIRDDGTFMINGIRSTMSKQLFNKPIVKVSDTRVSLASSCNKTIVEKMISNAHDFSIYINSVINKINEEIPLAIHVEYGSRKFTRETDCGYEYYCLAKRYDSLTIKHQHQNAISYLYFGDPKDRRKSEYMEFLRITAKQWEEIEKYEVENHCIFLGMKLGTATYSGARYYMDRGSRLLMVGEQDNTPFKVIASVLDLIQGATDIKYPKQLTEWTEIKIMDGKFPVGFLLCYRFGLLTMLRRLSVKYKIVNTRSMKNEEVKPTDILLKFGDNKGIVIPRYPLKISMIFQGLSMFKLNVGTIEEYEQKDIYFRLLMDKRKGTGRTNYLIGIDDTFDMFIDRMTFDRLVQMGEPTTFEGLLIRATEMLTVPYHQEAAAMANHCIRTYERMNSILYNEMVAQLRVYRKQRGPAATFSINPNAVLQRIIQDQSVQQVEDINPIHDIKMTTKVTYLGMGGRTLESLTVPDRRYPIDGPGLLSEATPDSGNVSVTAQTSMNPVLGNIYGLIKPNQKPEDLDPTQLLSVSALLMPCVTNDDGKRSNFVNVQLSHTMPTLEGECLRVSTGYEKMIAHRCTDIYAFTAKQDGSIIDVDDNLKIMKIQYLDGTVQALSYAPQYGECSDMYTEQQQVITCKKGDKFKKHEVLRYNPQFFEPDPDLKRQVSYKHGVTATVAIIENSTTFEDSNPITEKLSKSLQISPIESRMFTISTETVIHEARYVDDQVEMDTPLMIFELEDTADLTGVTTDLLALQYLEKLNRTSPKAKTKGTIVDVKIYHACDLDEMHPSLSAMIKKHTKRKQVISKFVKDVDNQYNFVGSSQVPLGSKYKGVTIDKSTVIIQYLIRQDLTSHAGDKVVIDSSLKSVTCTVMEHPAFTEGGKEIDMLFSATSVSNRIVNSPLLVGVAENVMETAEQKCIEMYFS